MPGHEMAQALLLFLGQVELIYKQERVASARESGKPAHRPRKLTPQLEEDLAVELSGGRSTNSLRSTASRVRRTGSRVSTR
ncbi:hypothetical protein [Kribbella sp. CA-294648]|uniref:hypothetical protein n=1 Tax=Kribbella sp. CA-294648 TaxID=3239948 RepID=UPI003D94A274